MTLGLANLIAPQSLYAQDAVNSRSIRVTLGTDVVDGPLSGRLLVFFSSQSKHPINGPNWFHAEPFFALDVAEFLPGTSQTIDDSAISFSAVPSRIPAGDYFVQAVFDLDQPHDFPHPARRPGNAFSNSVRVRVAAPAKQTAESQVIDLVLDQVVQPPVLADTDRLKFMQLPSRLLSEFYRRPVIEHAAVVLPAGYDRQPARRYPVKYEVTGFGATLKDIQQQYGNPAAPGSDDDSFIHVILTGECEWGHHVYANSETNGPRGDAFVSEMIPLIDRKFRTIADPAARVLTGHSSGGWSSLWLQVTYPKMFGGVWSTAPDPVDFRDFQNINLYDPAANFFVDDQGRDRPLARRGNRPIVSYRDFSAMEEVLGRGGQLRSFEAVFGSLNPEGQPERCWNRFTGKADADAIKHWRRYDISRIIQERSDQLRHDLAGKIHVYMGTMDTFYLDGAVPLLADRLKSAKIPATIEMFPGKDHFNLMTTNLKQRVANEMKAATRR